jgi:hypothetical protein
MEGKNGSFIAWAYIGFVLGVLGYMYWEAQNKFKTETARRLWNLETAPKVVEEKKKEPA